MSLLRSKRNSNFRSVILKNMQKTARRTAQTISIYFLSSTSSTTISLCCLNSKFSKMNHDASKVTRKSTAGDILKTKSFFKPSVGGWYDRLNKRSKSIRGWTRAQVEDQNNTRTT